MKTLTLAASLLTAALLTPAVFAPTPAIAAEGDGEGYATRTEKDGYGVTFLDDLLGAEGIDSAAPMIRASFRPMRGLLIRPRASFVPELVSTADDL
jgi:hypothetical protein